ncbi:kinase-like protein [Xylona heveae TC161]|uniref:mitogen-activated protein kinase kinase n=1 Tax=Xylona heveae (strain CBS 132557 / TC161) TaxID=1328760 RepID=A0A165HKC8_XYLHT|nr:kinase-like protein [Xylona heveae TC161]KZF23642.1 kinase-like protein [Xylona heveae TC161]
MSAMDSSQSQPELVQEPATSSSETTLPADNASGSKNVPSPTSSAHPPRLQSSRTSSEAPPTSSMTASSTPLGQLSAARRPGLPAQPATSSTGASLRQDIEERMRQFQLSRPRMAPSTPSGPPSAGTPPIGGPVVGGRTPPSPAAAGIPAGAFPGAPSLKFPPHRPQAPNWTSAPAVTNAAKRNPKPSLGARRGMALPGGLPGTSPAAGPLGKPKLDIGAINNGVSEKPGAEANPVKAAADPTGSLFNKFSEIVDTKSGTLNFAGKAVIHGKGIDFTGGNSFNISLDEVDTLEELGKGNYGTVYKVRHSRPQMRRPGLGLNGNKATASFPGPSTTDGDKNGDQESPVAQGAPIGQRGTTGIVMAMKEMRLELDEARFAAIIMELDILHRCISPFIIDFYGAFFQEGAVYICMEFMDGGSIDKLYGDGVPENVLRKITLATLMGLKALKDEHNIIHRDVKPTNILVNTRGQIKICDFGVSGNLVASIAKTNIGCQSYMAPERIAGGGVAQAGANPGGGTYSVQSDIWSLGLTIIECALGRYPYPPETYNNIFSQLSAIVDGDPPDLPQGEFSEAARDFVRGCLNKIPKLRPTYAMLLRHAWLAPLVKPATISEEDEHTADGTATSSQPPELEVADQEVAAWVKSAIEARIAGTMGKHKKPALHAAPLDAVASPPQEKTNGFEQISLPVES